MGWDFLEASLKTSRQALLPICLSPTIWNADVITGTSGGILHPEMAVMTDRQEPEELMELWNGGQAYDISL